MLTALRQVHAWSGVALCLVLAVLGLSGALLVFKQDYVRLVVPEARTTHDASAMAMGRALEAIEARYGAEGLRYVTLAQEGLAVHQVGFADGGGAYVDQAGGEIARWPRNGRAEEWLFDLHHHLLGGDTGEIIAGLAGLFAALMVVSGLIIWAPAARSFAWRVWPSSAARRDLLGQHRDLGVLLALPIIGVSLTGAAMVFPDQGRWLMNVLTVSRPTPPPAPVAQAGDVDWVAAVQGAASAFPGAAPRMAVWPNGPDKPAALRLRRPTEWHPNGRTSVSINPATGAVIGAVDAERLTPGERAFNAVYPLHAAKVGGRVWDVMAALTGIGLAVLSVVGAFAFLRRPRRRRRVGAAV